MSTAASTLPQNPDPGAVYKAAYDALGEAYWDASDLTSKDTIYGAQQAMGEIITAFNQQQLATNTALFIELTPKMKAINTALTQIEKDISTITKNINTASMVIAAINKVLSLYPSLTS